jgi:hypothetical protein
MAAVNIGSLILQTKGGEPSPLRVSQGDLIESKVDVITAPGASRGAPESQILIDSWIKSAITFVSSEQHSPKSLH